MSRSAFHLVAVVITTCTTATGNRPTVVTQLDSVLPDDGACGVTARDAAGSIIADEIYDFDNVQYPSMGLFTSAVVFGDVTQGVEAGGEAHDLIFVGGSDLAPQAPYVRTFPIDMGTNYSPSWTADATHYSGRATIGDLDGDGHDDLVVAQVMDRDRDTRNAGLLVYYGTCADNKRGVNLADRPVLIPGHGSYAVAAADLDGDLDLDLAISEIDPELGFPPREDKCFGPKIYRNDGDRKFTVSTWSGTGRCHADLMVSDVDSDGQLDLVALGMMVEVYFGNTADSGIRLDSEPRVSIPVTTPRAVAGTSVGFELASLRVDDREWVVATAACVVAPDRIDMPCDPPVTEPVRAFAFDRKRGSEPVEPSWVSDEAQSFGAVMAEDIDADGAMEIVAGVNWGGELRVWNPSTATRGRTVAREGTGQLTPWAVDAVAAYRERRANPATKDTSTWAIGPDGRADLPNGTTAVMLPIEPLRVEAVTVDGETVGFTTTRGSRWVGFAKSAKSSVTVTYIRPRQYDVFIATTELARDGVLILFPEQSRE